MKKLIILAILVFTFTACAQEAPLRNHINGNPEICAEMNFTCDEGETYFLDETGCGCEYWE